MQLLLWAILPSAHALFFNLGGGGGGCSCPSSCGSPPPDNFGCRLMCAGQQMSCQQQAFNQQFAQQPLAQPNFGIPAPAIPQPLPTAPIYNNYQNPAPAYNYQQEQQYARPMPQYTAYGQQPRVVQPQLVAPAPPQQYLPQAPTRQDTYANSLNQISTGYGPQAPVAPPVYGQQQTTDLLASHQPTNPLPASFVSVPQQGPIGSPSAETQEVNLLPPEQPGTEQTEVQSVAEPSQNTNYATDSPAPNYGKSAGNDFSFSITEKKTPDEIAQSIEDSYDEQGDLMEISTSAVQVDEEKDLLTNQVFPNENYVTTQAAAPLDFEGLTEIQETQTARTEVMEYALGNIGPVKAEVPQTAVSPSSSYKTLTRAEGLSSTYAHQENINQSETTEAAPETDTVTEDYAAEETENNNGAPAPAPEETASGDGSSGYNKKFRLPIDSFFDTTIATTTEIHAAKRSENAEQRAFKCNSAKLKNIMDDKMTVSAPVSKQLIYAEATAQFPGLSLDVICSRHSFSYIVVTSPIYCEHRKSPLTCFAFFQP